MEYKQKLNQMRIESLECLSKDALETLIDEMLVHIGSNDSELRDKLIYSTFIRLIDGGFLSKHQYQYLFETCLDDQHLFFKIEEKQSDAVFTRSFSSLVIAALLLKDKQLGFLSEEKVDYAFKRIVSYFENELDTRGYVEEKGWAHSIAHGADMVASLVKNEKFKEENIYQILNIIRYCLFKEARYIDEEDERLIFVIETLQEKGLEEAKIEEWIIQIFNQLEFLYTEQGYSNKYYQTKVNIVNFMKTLYFRFKFKNDYGQTRELINIQLKGVYQKIYGF